MSGNAHADRRRGGFTIVEILVVVVIIGVLATMIVPKLFSKVGKAKQSVAKQKLAVLEGVVETFSAEYGRLPESLDDLVQRPADIPEEMWETPTVKPKDLLDPWGRTFIYKQPGDHSVYDLYSLGKDEQEGDSVKYCV